MVYKMPVEMINKSLISEWVEQYTNEMLRWAFHKVSDIELAKDLVQDTFLIAAEKQSSFKGESKPKTWLFSILNHKIICEPCVEYENQSITIDKEIANIHSIDKVEIDSSKLKKQINEKLKE